MRRRGDEKGGEEGRSRGEGRRIEEVERRREVEKGGEVERGGEEVKCLTEGHEHRSSELLAVTFQTVKVTKGRGR